MFQQSHLWIFGLASLLVASGCQYTASESENATSESANVEQSVADPGPAGRVVTFQPGPEIQQQVMEELILAEPGTVFQFEAGLYEFTEGLSLTVENVTIRGRGMDQTVLSFKNQEAGAEGLYITSDHVTVEDLAIEDTKGNGLKALKADHLVLRRVRAEWTGGPLPTNGAYGLYPVSSRYVLVEACVAIGGSDSGIYVGQSQDVIVRDCQASYNVAGIEIENCHRADVYDNEAFHNTGGILVFDLPDLPQQRGHDVRVFNNKIYDNNTENFAPEGNIVGTVPTGTGIMVMANSNVEIFANDIRDHQTVNTLIVSYLTTNIEIKDPDYYPYAEQIHIHGNTYGRGGYQPGGLGGQMIAAVAGMPIPDIVWDGVVNPEKIQDGRVIREAGLSIHGNQQESGELTFVNLGGIDTLQNPLAAKPMRDLEHYSDPFPSVAPVTIPGVE